MDKGAVQDGFLKRTDLINLFKKNFKYFAAQTWLQVKCLLLGCLKNLVC
jgi:hypothetical protein